MKREMTSEEILYSYVSWLEDKAEADRKEELLDFGEVRGVSTMEKGVLEHSVEKGVKFTFSKAKYSINYNDIEFFKGHDYLWGGPYLNVEGGFITLHMFVVDWAEKEI